jgi:hypothetical protein
MDMLARLSALLLVSVTSIGATPPRRDSLDAIARAYVQLTLEAGEREQGYVDAYYGPPEWAAAAKRTPRTVQTLEADARRLGARAAAIAPASLAPLERRRRAFLIGQLNAAETRMAMAGGRRFSFDDEATGLFGVRPRLTPLADLEASRATLDRLLPGAGTLEERAAAYRKQSIIPADRLVTVVGAAIAECRRRTLTHVPLPPSEKFTLALAKDKSWGAYNYYKGDYTSAIEVNTDRPNGIAAATDYGCHEGYPGHHVYNMLLEREMVKKRGWIEFSVYPLYSPQSLLAEGSANYGIDLAFPGAEREAYEARVLYPLAGLTAPDPALAARIDAVNRTLSKARFAIAREYLDGRIDRPTAVALTTKYMLLPPSEASKSLTFTEQYRSYVINYGYGMELVRGAVEAAGVTPAARWAAMARILSEPTTPAMLIAAAAAPRRRR